MSQKKINKNSSRRRWFKQNDKFLDTGSVFPLINEETDEMDINCINWQIHEDDIKYMPLYDEAHALLSQDIPYLIGWSMDIVEVFAWLLKTPEEELTRDQKLAAIGILGHSPCPTAIKALSEFSKGTSEMAGAARLALAECATLFAERAKKQAS